MEYLNDWEKKKVNMCLTNIVDKIGAIQIEIIGDKAYKGYLLEKITSALHDMQVIKNICEREE